MKEAVGKGTTAHSWQRRTVSVVLQFVVLFAFWLVLCCHFQLQYYLMGAAAAGLVTYLTNDLLYASLQQGESLRATVGKIFLQMWRFILYIPWLLLQIVIANVQVALLVLNPRMPVDPALLLFSTGMKKNMARVTLANSITLTPGTITVDLEDNNYIVHTLKPPLAEGLVNATMQNKVAKVYLEGAEKPPSVRWVYSLEEI